MAPNESERIVRQVIELGFNEGALDKLDGLVAKDFVEHQFGAESGIEGVKELIRGLRTAFPDLHMTVEDLATSGDKVWLRLRCRGTQKGPLMGIPPTGRSIDTMALEICRVENGKFAEHWGVPDRFAAMAQLGMMESPGGAASPSRPPTRART